MHVTLNDLLLLEQTVWARCASSLGFSDAELATSLELKQFVTEQNETLFGTASQFLLAYEKWWTMCFMLEQSGLLASEAALEEVFVAAVQERNLTREELLAALS